MTAPFHESLTGKALDRAPHCGGTDAAAIVCSALGVAYYRSAWEVWAERFAPDALPPRPAQEQTWLDLGNVVERYTLKRYEREQLAPNGLSLGDPITLHGPEPYQWMRAQTDSVVYDEVGNIVGIGDGKTSRQIGHWWETDDEGERVESMPYGYEVQGRWYMGVFRLAGHPVRFFEDAVIDLLGARFWTRGIEHDEQQWGGILAIVIPWWERHVINGERPINNDHDETCRRWHLYCAPREKGERPATEEEAQAVADWLAAKAEAGAAADRAKALEGALLARMDTERLRVGSSKRDPYVQVQAAGRKGRCLRAYRFTQEKKA